MMGSNDPIPQRAKFERRRDWWLYKERHLLEKYFFKVNYLAIQWPSNSCKIVSDKTSTGIVACIGGVYDVVEAPELCIYRGFLIRTTCIFPVFPL